MIAIAHYSSWRGGEPRDDPVNELLDEAKDFESGSQMNGDQIIQIQEKPDEWVSEAWARVQGADEQQARRSKGVIVLLVFAGIEWAVRREQAHHQAQKGVYRGTVVGTDS